MRPLLCACLVLVVASFGSACGVKVPQAVSERPHFTSFDPAGTWYVSIRSGDLTWTATAIVTPIEGGPWYRVLRSDRPTDNDFALTERDELYVAYSDNGKRRTLNLVSLGDGFGEFVNLVGSPPAPLLYEKWGDAGFRGSGIRFESSDGSSGFIDFMKVAEEVEGSPELVEWELPGREECGVRIDAANVGYVATRGVCTLVTTSSSSTYSGVGSSQETKTTTTSYAEQQLAETLGVSALKHAGGAMAGQRISLNLNADGSSSWWYFEETWSRTPPPSTGTTPPEGWTATGRRAVDVGVGLDGSVWILAAEAGEGGFALYKQEGGQWVAAPGGGVRLAVGPDGSPWVITDEHLVRHLVDGAWVDLPEQDGWGVVDIGVGADGVPWILRNRQGLDYQIAQLVGGAWQTTDGLATRIAVGADSSPWVVNSTGAIFQRVNGQWQHIPGLASDVGAGASVWVVGTDNHVFRLENGNWVLDTALAKHIAVGPDGVPWIVAPDGEVMHR